MKKDQIEAVRQSMKVLRKSNKDKLAKLKEAVKFRPQDELDLFEGYAKFLTEKGEQAIAEHEQGLPIMVCALRTAFLEFGDKLLECEIERQIAVAEIEEKFRVAAA